MISVIIVLYNEEKNLTILQQELNKELSTLGKDYEIIYVDDGSKDKSAEVLKQIVKNNNKTKMIQLSKNYGQTKAMQAGIDHAKGEILVFLDADLQNDPKDIPRLLNKIEEGFDIVSGWRKERKDPLLSRRLPSYIANLLISSLSGIKLHDYGCTLKAYRKEVIKQIRLYGEMHRLVPIYAAREGAAIAEIEISHRKRFSGKSKYSFLRAPKVILDFFVAEFMSKYLSKPIYIFGAGALFLLGIGIFLGFFIITRKVFLGGVWVSPLLFLMVIFILTGFQFLLMGFLCEIIIRLYYQNTGKLTYFVKNVIKKD